MIFAAGLSLSLLWSQINKKSNGSILGQVMQLPRDSALFDTFLREFNTRHADQINRFIDEFLKKIATKSLGNTV